MGLVTHILNKVLDVRLVGGLDEFLRNSISEKEVIGNLLEPYDAGYRGIVSVLGHTVHWSPGNTNLVTVAAFIDLDGNMYLSGVGFVAKYNKDGALQWNSKGSAGISAEFLSIKVDNNGMVYGAVSDGTVRKLDINGNQVWEFTGHSGQVLDVALSGDYVYSVGYDGTLRKIHSVTGLESWSRNLGSIPVCVSINSAGDKIFCGLANGAIVCMDLGADQELWRNTTSNNNIIHDLALGSVLGYEYVFVVSENQNLVKLNASTGVEVSRFTQFDNVPRCLLYSPVTGHVYTGDNSGNVKRIDPNTMTLVWNFWAPSTKINNIRGLAEDPDTGHILIAPFSSKIRKIDNELQIKGFRVIT